MVHPKTGEKMVVGWILYSYEEMVKSTNYYKDEYGLRGTLLATSIEEFYRR